MLARLDEIPGVAESRVDWTGQRFLLRLEPSADESRVAQLAETALGEDCQILGEREERAALDAYRRGEAWMRAGETLRLSQYEAGVLAERHGREAAREIGLGRAAERKLVDLFARELARGFERSHPTDGGEEGAPDIEEICERILASSEVFLDPRQRAALEEYLARIAGARSGSACP